ncbi:formyltetrahydrofolate deformylase [Janibacter sp. Soil728]|uniref:formyltetrahydrofolate deformylase n=1 Tax=Janibacter sp. Soil728 TaxID=1736393 RepID=UPI000AA3D3AB|nr:formyltetrahydrofolate deformylase [Janibacter sp. Soil728]
MDRGLGREVVLTLSGPDRRGIVHAVTGAMVGLGLNILDSQQFGDSSTGEFHLRMHLQGESDLDGGALEAERARLAAELGADVSIHDPHEPHRLLVMVSRQGHVLNDLLFRVRTGQLNVVVPAVVSNHEDFRAEVEWHGIPFHHVPVTRATKPQAEAALREIIEAEQVETVVLARYMQVLSEGLCADFPGRIINIHHSLLPSFKGARPYSQAHERGVKVIGATAHYVTSDLDEGPIIEQDFRRVDHRMSPAQLAATGAELEAMAFARALRWHVERRVVLRGRRTIVFD